MYVFVGVCALYGHLILTFIALLHSSSDICENKFMILDVLKQMQYQGLCVIQRYMKEIFRRPKKHYMIDQVSALNLIDKLNFLEDLHETNFQTSKEILLLTAKSDKQKCSDKTFLGN
jgi:hypothetical protein